MKETNAIAVAQQKHDEEIKQLQKILIQNARCFSILFQKIRLPDRNAFVVMDIKDIIRCQAEGNNTRFYFIDLSNLLVSISLKFYEGRLTGSDFFRVHKTHLLNLRHVKKYSKGEDPTANMADGSQVQVSRRKKEEFYTLMDDLIK